MKPAVVVEVDRDVVVVEGTRVARPGCVSVSQWLRFWEQMDREADYWTGYEHGISAASRSGE